MLECTDGYKSGSRYLIVLGSKFLSARVDLIKSPNLFYVFGQGGKMRRLIRVYTVCRSSCNLDTLTGSKIGLLNFRGIRLRGAKIY